MLRLMVYGCVTLSAFFWGSAFHATKVSVEAMPPFTAATLRFGMAACILLAACLVTQRGGWEQVRRNALMLTVLGLLGVTGFAGFLFWGLAHTSAINGSMIMGTNPLMVMLLSRVLYQEPISRRQKMGAALGVLGVVAVVAGGSWDGLLHLRVAPGDGLILLANISWGLYTVLTRRLSGVKPLVLTTATMCVGSLALAAVALGEHGGAAVRAANANIWWAIVYLAVFGSVLAFLFWNWGISVLGTQRTSIFFNLVPFFAVLTGLALGGAVAPSQLLGGGLVIAGVLTATGVIRI